MTAVLDDRSPAALRDFTHAWLAEHLPAGWMDAADRDDTDTLAALARVARLRRMVHPAR